MNLALVTHKFVRGDGQSRVNYEIAHHALQQGVNVWLLAEEVDTDLLEDGARWIKVQPRQKQTDLIRYWEFARLADRALAKMPVCIDIIHANGYTLSTPHHVNTSHFVHAAWRHSPVHTARVRRDLYGLYQWTFSVLNTRWERRAYSEACHIAAVSEQVRCELIAAGMEAKKISVVVNGVDLVEFAPGRENRVSLGLPIDVPLALFVGEIRTPRKNLDTVLEAMKTVQSLHIAVVGALASSPYPAIAERLGIASRVHFLNFRRDVAALMRAADFFVFPSRYEACSLVLLEAMASGLPIITAATAGGAEIITSESGIVMANPNDVKELRKAMQLLLEKPHIRLIMGTAARKAVEHHSWKHMASEYMELYAQQYK